MVKPHFTISPSNIPDVFLHSLRRRYPISSAGEEKKKKQTQSVQKHIALSPLRRQSRLIVCPIRGIIPLIVDSLAPDSMMNGFYAGLFFDSFTRYRCVWKLCLSVFSSYFFYSQSLLQPFYLCELLNCSEYICICIYISATATQKCISVLLSAFGTGSGYYAFISYFPPSVLLFSLCTRIYRYLNKKAVLSQSFYVDGR